MKSVFFSSAMTAVLNVQLMLGKVDQFCPSLRIELASGNNKFVLRHRPSLNMLFLFAHKLLGIKSTPFRIKVVRDRVHVIPRCQVRTQTELTLKELTVG